MYNEKQDQELFTLVIFFAFCLFGAWVVSQLDLRQVAYNIALFLGIK